MSDKLKKILKDNNVDSALEKYLMGESKSYYDYYYYWENLVPAIYKEFGLDSDYTIRVVDLLFQKNTYDAHNIYFSSFESNTEEFKKAINFLSDKLKYDLSKSIHLYLSYDQSLSDNSKLLGYFYEKDYNEVENIISYYGKHGSTSSSGGYEYYYTNNISSYLEFMKQFDSDEFKEKIKKMMKNMDNILSFSSYIPFFTDTEDKEEVLDIGLTRVLDSVYASQKTKDVILNFVKTGEKDKKFDKLIKKISTINKSYLYQDFTSFIGYKKPDTQDVYDQRLIDVSMKIDKYRTIQKLLFIIYTKEFDYKMAKSNLDNVLENWDAITYTDIIDFLSHHMAVDYYGLDANKFFATYLREDFDKVLKSLVFASGKGLDAVLDVLYQEDKVKTNQFILDNIAIFKGKSLLSKVVSKIQMEKENYPQIIELSKHKKSNVREIAIKALIQINDETNLELLTKIQETEKSKSIQELLRGYLVKFRDKTELEAEIVDYYSKKEILKRAESSKEQDYTDVSKFPKLIWAEDNTELNENFSKHFIYLLKKGKKVLIATEETKKVISLLTEESIYKFFAVIDDKYEKTSDWYLRGIPFTKDDRYLDDLKEYISQLISRSRGATAAKIVDVIASFKTTKAVQLLDHLTLKKNAKDARVNRGAVAAINTMAKEMNLTKEDLLDFIIPDFGFDKTGNLSLDFGPRQFTVSLQSDLTMLIKDSNGKSYKNLPKVGKNDDSEIGSASTKLFKSIKKDLKKQVKLEKDRLERGFSGARIWSGENWLKLFVNNPMMRTFAMGLIWGIYKEGKLVDSFRYLDDGSFSNIDDDELNIKNSDNIALIHPVELSEAELNTWKETLEDYEIIQSFEQIHRPVFKYKEKNKDKNVLDDFKGFMLGRFALRNNLFNAGWSRGVIEDAGCYYYYDKNFSDGTFVALNFLGDYIGNYDDNQEVPIYDIEISKYNKKLKISDIPARLYSELFYELKKITDKGSGFNAEWEKVSW